MTNWLLTWTGLGWWIVAVFAGISLNSPPEQQLLEAATLMLAAVSGAIIVLGLEE